jgi:hypothetical protein
MGGAPLAIAIDSAQSGDTLYIVGSPTSYGTSATPDTLTKNLTLIGNGFNNSLNTTCVIYPLARGSNFYGLSVLFASHLPDSTALFRCSFNFLSGNDTIGSNTHIAQCYYNASSQGFIGLLFGNSYNVLIENSVFTYIVGNVAQNTSGTSASVTFRNCIIGNASNTGGVALTNSFFYNSILLFTSGGSNIYGNNNTYTNCLLSDYNSASLPLGYGNTYVSCDTFPTSPGFISVANEQDILLSDNCGLQAGSALLGGGANGTDIGLTGGTFPFDFVRDGKGVSPTLSYFYLSNSTVPLGSNLYLNLKAVKTDQP